MSRLSPVDKAKLDKLENSPIAENGGGKGRINKDLPLNPAEIAGLREQKRQYTKELQSKKKNPDVDPNQAYPDIKNSSTLRLCSIPLIAFANSVSAGTKPHLDIHCGPLLKYVWTDYKARKGPMALYTVLIVTDDARSDYSVPPVLEVAGINTDEYAEATMLTAQILHQERSYTFWRWKIYVVLNGEERRLAYNINGSKENLGFWVPGANQPMRIMFHSCNGISHLHPTLAIFSPS